TTVVCLTEKTYEFYRKRSHPQIPLICLPIPKVWWKMNFPDWARLFSRRTWNTCVLIKGTFDTGDWILDLAVRYYFGNYLTIEHSMVDTIPSKTSRRHWGIFPGVGLWWYRKRLQSISRSLGPRKVICVSDAVRRRLIEEYSFPARKVITVQN